MCTHPVHHPAAVERAYRWLRLLRSEDTPSDLCRAWIAFLETVTLNYSIGAPCAGLAPPLEPLESCLGHPGDHSASGLPN